MTFHNGGDERMRIDASGNVGIGTVSPASKLHVKSTADNIVATQVSTNTVNALFQSIESAGLAQVGTSGAHPFTFFIANQERARIDTSGNLLVGKTSANSTIAGVQAISDGRLFATVSNDHTLIGNRLSSDGAIATFQKDGTTVGSIAVDGGGAVIRNYWDVRSAASIGSGLGGNDGFIQPLNKSGTSDAQIDLGSSSSRFKDLYLSGGLRGDTTFKNNAGTTEYARFDASGNLLVGKTSAAGADINVVGNVLKPTGANYFTATSDGSIFNRLTTDGTIIDLRKNGTTVGSIASKDGDLAIGTGTVGVRFLDGSSAIVPQNHSTNSGTDGLLDLGVGAARFKDLYLSGGVYLGGTVAANLLDDYEEGDYDATVTCSTSGTVTLEADSNRASYTKVGRLVTVTGLLIVDSISSPVGYAVISLPFAAATGTDRMADSAASVVLEASLSVNLGDFLATVNEGSASLYLLLGNSTSWSGSNSAGQLSHATQITFSVTYITP
jgi:hypothetical protein